MLITEMKSKETLCSLISGKVFIINCHGCKEVRFPEKEAKEFQKELASEGKVTGILTTDYICNPENIQQSSVRQHHRRIQAPYQLLQFRSCVL